MGLSQYSQIRTNLEKSVSQIALTENQTRLLIQRPQYKPLGHQGYKKNMAGDRYCLGNPEPVLTTGNFGTNLQRNRDSSINSVLFIENNFNVITNQSTKILSLLNFGKNIDFSTQTGYYLVAYQTSRGKKSLPLDFVLLSYVLLRQHLSSYSFDR